MLPPDLLTKPAPRKRKPSIARAIKQAERSGKKVTSAILPDGTKLTFGEPEPSEATNPWLTAVPVRKRQ